MRLFATIILWAISAATLAGEQLPELSAKTLDGQAVRIPGRHPPAAFVLMFGFSQDSQKAFAAWDKLLGPKFASSSRVAYWELPVLQRLPFFVKPLVLRGMRKAIQPTEQSRFAPLFMGEKQIRSIVQVSDPNAAYLVVADSKGEVKWQTHSAASESSLRELDAAVEALLGHQ